MSEHKRVTVGILDEDTTGIAPSGRGTLVPAGAYVVVDLDGLGDGITMLREPGSQALKAMVPTDQIAFTREVRDSPYATQWARYFRDHPHVLASWGEQNYRPCPGYETES